MLVPSSRGTRDAPGDLGIKEVSVLTWSAEYAAQVSEGGGGLYLMAVSIMGMRESGCVGGGLMCGLP